MSLKEQWEKIKRDACQRKGGFFNPDTPVWVEDDLKLFDYAGEQMAKIIIEWVEKHTDLHPKCMCANCMAWQAFKKELNEISSK